MAITQRQKGDRGRRAEKAVARRLWWDGYRILERNYTTRAGEVDIIARKGDTVAFVEVRSRQEGSAVSPRDTVSRTKEKRIDAAASAFLKSRRLAEVSVRYDIAEKPGISNLLEIMSATTGRSVDDLAAEYATGGYGRFKEAVAEAIVAELASIRASLQNLDDAEVARLLQKGALDARTRAERHQQDVRDAVGLGRF